jgi:hypothetical protein
MVDAAVAELGLNLVTTQEHTKVEDGIVPETQFAKENWYLAYLRGNSTWPQTGTLLAFPAVNEIVQDPNITLDQLSKTTLSPAQIEKIGVSMTSLHRNKGISVEYDSLPVKHIKETEPHTRKIPEAAFQSLWHGVTVMAPEIAKKYIAASFQEMREDPEASTALGWDTLYIKDEGNLVDYELTELLEESLPKFFAMKNSPYFQRFQKVVEAATKAIESTEGYALATEYRKTFDRSDTTTTLEQKQTKQKEQKEKIGDLVKNKIDEKFKESFPGVSQFTDALKFSFANF